MDSREDYATRSHLKIRFDFNLSNFDLQFNLLHFLLKRYHYINLLLLVVVEGEQVVANYLLF
jgi:hypothetical protein